MRGSLEEMSATTLHPLDVMWQALTGMDIPFLVDDGRLYSRLWSQMLDYQETQELR